MSEREILYRGKRVDNGEWVVGLPGYDINGNLTEIEVFKGFARCYALEVEPETIGQYTGLTDKNGRKIFDGDIVRVIDNSSERYVGIGNVSFEEGAWYINGELQERIYWLDDYIDYEFEVIGSVFDNPELLDNGGGSE